MINVLNIIDTGGPGGAETVFLHTSASLDSDRFHSTAVVSREGWLAGQLRQAGVEPEILPARGSFNIRYLLALLRLVRRRNIHVVLAHLYGSAIYASLVGMISRVPVVVILHGQTDVSRSSRLAAAKAWVVRKGARKVIFVSENLRRDLCDALPLGADQHLVIPNGVDTSAFAPRRDRGFRRSLGIKDSDILVGAVGNIRAPKDYGTLLRAAAILCNANPNYRFLVCGEGSGSLYNELLALKTDLQLANNVSFLGLRNDVANVMNNLDVYVLSSTTEGFSIACVEAMACGVPVVATRSGGPQLIIEDNTSGLLVPVSDPQALAAAIRRVGENPTLAARLAEGGLQRVRSQYALPVMLRAYEDTLSTVMESRL
jgi:glycosyltransferase involved in cell wall biosynthesis